MVKLLFIIEKGCRFYRGALRRFAILYSNCSNNFYAEYSCYISLFKFSCLKSKTLIFHYALIRLFRNASWRSTSTSGTSFFEESAIQTFLPLFFFLNQERLCSLTKECLKECLSRNTMRMKTNTDTNVLVS